jgi:hypothetical protein
MTDKTNELGIVDTSSLTDADWAEINKLRRAHDEGGQRALSKTLTELIDVDPVRATRVIGAFFPERVRETIKDVMAEKGITIEDIHELLQKLESPARKQ